MWRTAGAGELYTYLPPGGAGNTGVCAIPPFSTCNPTFGASVGRGAFTFATGAWTTVAQRVRLNDAGVANGELELFANGQSVVSASGLTLRNATEGRIYGIQAQTFFGGEHVLSALTMMRRVADAMLNRWRGRVRVAQGPGCVFLRLLGSHHRAALRRPHAPVTTLH